MRRKKSIDTLTITLIILFILAFSLHVAFISYVYSGPLKCREIDPGTSFFVFAPSGILFIVFIWVIFKLLVVWRVMISNTQNQQEKERSRLQTIKFAYLIVWIILWLAQRTFEYITITQRADTNQDVEDWVRYTLLTSNIMELIMELCLYGWLIRVSFILSRFLKSFDESP